MKLSHQLIFLYLYQAILADNSDFPIMGLVGTPNNNGRMYGVAVDDQDGSVYLWGQRSWQVVLTKLAPNTTQLWSVQFGNSSFAGDVVGPNPVIDPGTRDIFVAGRTTGSFDSQPIQPKLGVIDWATLNNSGYTIMTGLYVPDLNKIVFLGVRSSGSDSFTNVLESNDSSTWAWTPAERQETGSLIRYSSVAWSPSLKVFVAVGQDGRAIVGNNTNVLSFVPVSIPTQMWSSICWSEDLKLFVAVASSGTGDRIMTSSNGTVWTTRSTPINNDWRSVVWSSRVSRFVAVASAGNADRVMTSSNGISWVSRTIPASGTTLEWTSVCTSEELGLFVAVAQSGIGNRVMTSPDGIAWTMQTSAVDNNWQSVIWAADVSLFVAVANVGLTISRMMTSPDGVNWFARETPGGDWTTIIWSPFASRLILGMPTGIAKLVSFGRDTAFVTRLQAANGNRLWTRFYGGPVQAAIWALDQTNTSLIACGSVYGAFHGNANLGRFDAFLVAIDKQNGSIIWSQQYGSSTNSDRSLDLRIDLRNNLIFTTGITVGTMGALSYGQQDVFITRHNLANGSQTSSMQLGSSGFDNGNGIVLGVNSTVAYVVGSADGVLQPGSQALASSPSDAFVAAVNITTSTMELLWTSFIGGLSSADSAYRVAVHPTTGVIYVSGISGGALVGSASIVQPISYGSTDMFLSAFNRDGTQLWTRVAGTSLHDSGRGLAINQNGVIFIAAALNNSDGFAIHTADATGNLTFPVPNMPAFASLCYSMLWTTYCSRTLISSQSAWISTSVQLATVTQTRTVTQIDTASIAAAVVTSSITFTVNPPTVTITQINSLPVTANPTTVTITQTNSISVPSIQSASTVSIMYQTVTVTSEIQTTDTANGSNNSSANSLSNNTFIIGIVVGVVGIIAAIGSFIFVALKQKRMKRDSSTLMFGRRESRYQNGQLIRENFFGESVLFDPTRTTETVNNPGTTTSGYTNTVVGGIVYNQGETTFLP